MTWNLTCAYRTIGGSHSDISVIILKSNTEGGNLSSNWNDYVGFTSGWDSDDVTEYSSEFVIDGFEYIHQTSTASFVLETLPLNATAKTDIEDDATFILALIDYDQIYLNSFDSSYGVSSNGERTLKMCSILDTDTAKRPYLEYTTGVVEVTYNAPFLGCNF